MAFRELACIVLGGIAGLLIGLPWAFTPESSASLVAPVLFGILGAATGYRQRRSVFFFYLCLVSILILATLFSQQLGGMQ